MGLPIDKSVQRIMIRHQISWFGAQTARPKQPQNSRDQMDYEKANGA